MAEQLYTEQQRSAHSFITELTAYVFKDYGNRLLRPALIYYPDPELIQHNIHNINP